MILSLCKCFGYVQGYLHYIQTVYPLLHFFYLHEKLGLHITKWEALFLKLEARMVLMIVGCLKLWGAENCSSDANILTWYYGRELSKKIIDQIK